MVSTKAKSKVLIAAHKESFDRTIFQKELQSAKISIPDWEWKDTIPIFNQVLWNEIESASLDNLCKLFLKKSKTEHRAKEDLDNLNQFMDLVAKNLDECKITSIVWGYLFSLMK